MDAVLQKTAEDAKQQQQQQKPKRSKKKKEANPSTVEKPLPGKARRIRIYPNKEEQKKLHKWIGTARWTYNECLKAVQSEGVPKVKKALRARAINEDAIDAMNNLADEPLVVRAVGGRSGGGTRLTPAGERRNRKTVGERFPEGR